MQIEKTLPEGVTIDPYLDRTKLVDNAIGTVTKNLAEGALIVIFVLVLMLGNMRAGLIVASVIPLAMLFAVSLMNLFGVSGNLMSLGAIDFGLIIDGAVIIIEATLHHLFEKHKGQQLNQQQMDKAGHRREVEHCLNTEGVTAPLAAGHGGGRTATWSSRGPAIGQKLDDARLQFVWRRHVPKQARVEAPRPPGMKAIFFPQKRPQPGTADSGRRS